jgi:hypothetical protein
LLPGAIIAVIAESAACRGQGGKSFPVWGMVWSQTCTKSKIRRQITMTLNRGLVACAKFYED